MPEEKPVSRFALDTGWRIVDDVLSRNFPETWRSLAHKMAFEIAFVIDDQVAFCVKEGKFLKDSRDSH